MARTMFVFYTMCKDPKREKELSDWYDNVHIPDVESLPGVLSCVRFEISDKQLTDGAPATKFDGGRPRYLSIVESEDDVDLASTRLRDGIAQWHAANRMSDLFDVISMATVSQVNPPPRPKR
jgi:hypothetical protein